MARPATSTWLALPCALLLAGCGSDHATLGREAYEARDYRAAVEELTWALDANPDDPELRFLLAQAQAHTAARFDAKGNFRECRKLPQYRKAASAHLARILLAERDFAGVEALIAEQLAEAPDDPETLELRGLIALKRTETELGDLAISLKDDVGEGSADWAIRRILEARTQEPAAFENLTKQTAASLQKSGLRDPGPFAEASRRAREIALRAQADFRTASAKDPLMFRSLAELGQMAIDRWDTNAAREHLLRVLAIDEQKLQSADARIAFAAQRSRSLKLLTERLEGAGATAEAVSILERELERGLLDAELEQRLGRLYLASGRLVEAAARAESLLARNPRDTWGAFIRGSVAAAKGDHKEAVTYFTRAKFKNEGNPLVNAALGRSLVKLGRDTEAAEAMRVSIAAGRANDVDLQLDYAQVLAREADSARAAQYLASQLRAVFTDPTSPAHQRILTEIRRLSPGLASRPATLDDARTIMARNPHDVFVKLTVAKMEHEQGLPTIALGRCQTVTTDFPGLADGWILQAHVLVALGRDADALQALTRAAVLRPDDANIPWLQGQIHARLGRIDEARRGLVRAREIDPRLDGPRLDLLDLEIKARNFAAALTLAEALVLRYPDDPRVLGGLGAARLAMKDSKGAIEPLRKAAGARPVDPTIRLRLAAALLEAGAPQEAKAQFAGLVADASAPLSIRREAAEALFRAGLFAQSAEAFATLFGSARSEAERVDLSHAALRARVAAGQIPAAIDELVRMRSSGRREAAERAFLIAAERAGFHREAAVQADILRTNDAHDADSLEAAARAHVALKQWNRAIEDFDDLSRLRPGRSAAIRIERARALLAIGKVADAAQAEKQPASRSTGDFARLLAFRLELAAAGSDPAAVESALAAVLAESPGDSAARLTAARALIAMGAATRSAQVIKAAPLRSPDEPGALLAAAVLVAAQDPVAALAVLEHNRDRGDRIVEAIGLVAVLLDKQPDQAARMASFLDRVGRRDAAGTRLAASRLADPPSIQGHWIAIAQAISGRPDLLDTSLDDLARARLFLDGGPLASRAFATLRDMADRGVSHTSLDVIRALWKVQSGDARGAADIVVPLLETQAKDAGVLLVAGLAGTAIAGPDAAARLLDAPGGPLPVEFLSDFARAMAAQGNHGMALRTWARLNQPSEEDRALRFLVLVERRDLKEARAALKSLPDAATKRPELTAARLWVWANEQGLRDKVGPELGSLAALPKSLEGVDLCTLYEAALVAGLAKEASLILDASLALAGFSAEQTARFADVLRRHGKDGAMLQRIEARLTILDPSGKLRAPAPRPITLP